MGGSSHPWNALTCMQRWRTLAIRLANVNGICQILTILSGESCQHLLQSCNLPVQISFNLFKDTFAHQPVANQGNPRAIQRASSLQQKPDHQTKRARPAYRPMACPVGTMAAYGNWVLSYRDLNE